MYGNNITLSLGVKAFHAQLGWAIIDRQDLKHRYWWIGMRTKPHGGAHTKPHGGMRFFINLRLVGFFFTAGLD